MERIRLKIRNYLSNIFNKETFDKEFEDVRSYLSNIPSINNGGCGYAALAMYRFLNKRHNSCRIVFLHDFTDSSSINNLKYLNGETSTADSCSHVCILYNNKLIDCKEEINVSYYRTIFVSRGEDMLTNALKNGKWNPDFDKRMISNIEQKLNINLSLE